MKFGQHLQNLAIDFGDDGIDEWSFSQPAYGLLGHQNRFYTTDVNGVSLSSTASNFNLNPITGEAVSGIFLNS